MVTPIYSSREAAKKLGISDRNVRRKAELYEIGRLIGRTWAFTTAEIARLRRLPTSGGRPRTPRRRRTGAARGRTRRQRAA